MKRDAVLGFNELPKGYAPPSWEQVSKLLTQLKVARQPVNDRIWEAKRAQRGDWEEVLKIIPSAYRKMTMPQDLPQIRDMLQRVTGLISKSPPNPEVMPPSFRPPDVRKASKEEARLNAMRVAIEDQQNRPTYAMGIAAQVSYGESYISVWSDPTRMAEEDGEDSQDSEGCPECGASCDECGPDCHCQDGPPVASAKDGGDDESGESTADDETGAGETTGNSYKRGKNESGAKYSQKYRDTMLRRGIPIVFHDHDPQTVYPLVADRERLALVIVESEHQPYEINVGMGYSAVKDPDGKVREWLKTGTVWSEPFVPDEGRRQGSTEIVDHNHDNGTPNTTSGKPTKPHKKTMFMDPWTYQCYLDGILVEEWRHNWGIVPMFIAAGEQTSDRDPRYASAGIADGALAVAKQIVFFSAVLASNAMQHGWPTPFVRNPSSGLIDPVTGSPLTRKIHLGEMNMLGPGEDIEFPYLQSHMMPDFFRHMDYLTSQLEGATLSNFGKAIGSDIAGYAIAQIRAMQMSVLSQIYTNASRQWRQIFAFLRWMIRTEFPGGVWLPGAVDETEDGTQYRPILEYSAQDCTEFAINVHIEEGIPQDEMAERKSSLEMVQGGLWSKRRAMERTGVEDPSLESDEISTDRLLGSPAFDQLVLQLATQLAAERYVATRQDESSPFSQALDAARQKLLGAPPPGGSPPPPGGSPPAGAGTFANQGAQPVNANPGGQPIQQNPPAPPPPQPGGPSQGPPAEGIPLGSLGIPGIPGGVQKQRMPLIAGGSG